MTRDDPLTNGWRIGARWTLCPEHHTAEVSDVLVRPRLSDIAAMDFHSASVAIDEGRAATERALALIAGVLGEPMAANAIPEAARDA